ncbi:dTDP-4-dehydrorhamnose reductase [Massilia sp. Root133]|uniref:dTDP-4-dehydrorhamnose reductase n=1 Tax=Massilia sp. Root133 TaxID=1736455 RepID=UPI0006F2E101|nr:dTDP-4-dehydrorhamnose reductase [Massilia sp. Root133]KQX96701.1 dTDP-4-dehydrorhamnose reductase [Massilia sp. Root133]
MKILLTGKNGQLGFELQRALAPLGEVVAVGTQDCNLADADALRALVRRVAPDVIVNPAAYTAVDKAESDEATARAVNAVAPAILGEEGAKLGALVLHYSTDYVFDGTKQGAYTENDVPAPQSVYGRTKLEGEQGLAAANPRHLILRTSWVVGAHGGNFAKTMLRLAGERETLTVVADQFGAPTPAALLADLSAHLVREHARARSTGFPYGTYHVAAGGETSWHGYAQFVIGEALAAGKHLKASVDAVAPLATEQYPTPARRPLNSRLDTTRFRTTFDLRLPPWQEGVRHVLRQIL